ncbi:MAG: hypothetical protein RIQ56_724, partial [Candidatus Parcubacteria bacterium]
MTPSIVSAVSLLKAALVLLTLAQGPNVSPAVQENATKMAQQAIVQATAALGGSGVSGVVSATSSLPKSTNPQCKPFPDETLLLPCPAGQSGRITKK